MPTSPHVEPRIGAATPRRWSAIAGALGAVALVVALLALRLHQINVVNYTIVRAPQPFTVTTDGFCLVILAGFAVLSLRAAKNGVDVNRGRIGSALAPLLLNAPLAFLAPANSGIPFFLTLVLLASTAWSAARLTALVDPGNGRALSHRTAMIALGTVILIGTLIHFSIQQNFFEHFMLGHSDFGHFTEELKNALRGRGLRSDSFDNTRLGWHFTPLLYALAPLYALWPSPHLLMVCGPLLLQLPALPIYLTARAWTRSAEIGLLVALAWLLHPSIGRMVYANTYGFEWVFMCVPLLAFALRAALQRRFALAGCFLILLWLCEETTTATTLGLAACMTLFTRHRKVGASLIVASLGYYLLCTHILIPHFAASGAYERFSLFGDLGEGPLALLRTLVHDPQAWMARLCRSSGGYFALLWLAPMALLPLVGWRLAFAAAPAAGLILLMQNTEWLSIKFWHQATILPVLFFAALLAFRPDTTAAEARHGFIDRFLGTAPLSHAVRCRCLAMAVFFAAALGHYLYGFSPLAKSYEPYIHNAALSVPDPRFAFVQELRSSIPRTATILASERIAAHFTDYRELYTGRRVRPADFIVLDRSDTWDTSDLPGRWTEFAADPEYNTWKERGSIVVFRRR